MAIVDEVLRQMAPALRARDLTRHRRELQTLDREIANLTTAIAHGGLLPPLLAELQTRQARREDVTAAITRAETVIDFTRISRPAIERKLRTALAAWHTRLLGAGEDAGQILRGLFSGPLVLRADGQSYRFQGELLVGSLLAGEVGPQLMWRARQVSNLRPPA